MALSVLLPAAAGPALAISGERSLYLHYTHTGETARITFKRNGNYVRAGLAELNQFLRDWRRDEPTQMDPALFDLIWEVYQEVGATEPINIVSAYRAPETNEMLRSRSSGVAKNSRHTQGMAMDFYIPGIPISRLREVAMKHQVGGVGYYPTSGSPFVHLDTGSVRAWPRMTRAQLQSIFPDGKTLHLPADGTPLSQQGRQYAMAEWQRCHQVPCSGGNIFGGGNTRVASAEPVTPADPAPNLFDLLFGGGEDDDGAPATAATPPSYPTPTIAPVPADLPASIQVALLGAPDPAPRPDGLSAPEAIAAAMGDSVNPASRPGNDSGIVTAYLPRLDDALNTQTLAVAPATAALTGQDAPVLQDVGRDEIVTASLGVNSGFGALTSLFDRTWNAVTGSAASETAATLTQQLVPNPKSRLNIEFTMPDFELAASVLTAPVAISSDHFGELYSPESAGFAPETELGALTRRIAFSSRVSPGISPYGFSGAQPLLLASR